MKRWRKPLYLIFGSITLILGAIGLVLPILPTTPFWLLTAYFFVNSSPKLHKKAMNNIVFGSIVRNFQLYKAIPKHVKIKIIAILWSSITLSTYIVDNIWITILLMIIAIAVTIHIISYPNLTKELKDRIDKEQEILEGKDRSSD